jgi:membrane protein implicated in regulation of membrane protease activity
MVTWSDFYLFCFLVGFLLSAASLFLNAAHVHIPHSHGHGHVDIHHGHGFSFFNLATVSAFLAWFGGAGFLLTRYSTLLAWLGLGVATASGLAGASAVFWFVGKVLLKHEQNLDPRNYEMVGVLGRVSSGIRPGGTGEMIFTQEGARRMAAARSEDGVEIPRETEVVVTRYEQGIAYVRRWDEMMQ